MNAKIVLLSVGLGIFAIGCASSPNKTSGASRWEAQFRKADINKDNKVSRQEFGHLMIEEAFAMFDTNKDGYVTEAEFVACGGSPESFKKLDRDGNGRVTLEEAKKGKIAMDAMTVAFYGADVDKDGYVTLEEALQYREKARAYTR